MVSFSSSSVTETESSSLILNMLLKGMVQTKPRCSGVPVESVRTARVSVQLC